MDRDPRTRPIQTVDGFLALCGEQFIATATIAIASGAKLAESAGAGLRHAFCLPARPRDRRWLQSSD
ncbi:MAG: hypothetical protein ACO1RT_08305 [Planctomycetaceae bacterium]